jgi:hypothetical protein
MPLEVIKSSIVRKPAITEGVLTMSVLISLDSQSNLERFGFAPVFVLEWIGSEWDRTHKSQTMTLERRSPASLENLQSLCGQCGLAPFYVSPYHYLPVATLTSSPSSDICDCHRMWPGKMLYVWTVSSATKTE